MNPVDVDVETTARVDDAQGKKLKAYLLYRRHLYAYDNASRLSNPGGSWLDIGCGMGYALEKIAQRADRVLAVDLAWTPLRGLPTHEKLGKSRADATALPLDDASIDHVMCFQVLEHVDRELAAKMLIEIRRVLKPGGVGFVTTPNARWRLLPGQPPWNPYHVVEYRPDEIAELCAESDIPRTDLHGVIGLHGAQEVEMARVKKNPFLVWGPHRARAWSQWKDRAPTPGLKEGRRFGRRRVSAQDLERDWFDLTDDFAQGLDFWIQVRGRERLG